MKFLTIVFIIILIIHVFSGIYAIIQIAKTNQFTKRQKVINIILVISLPIFWSVLMYYMFKKEPESYEYEPKDRFVPNDFHESRKGFYR